MIIRFYNDAQNKGLEEAVTKLVEHVEGKEFEYIIDIKRHRRQRTNAQNGYYWGVVLTIIATHIGDTIEAVHKDMATRFNPHQITYPDGTIVMIQGETKVLNTAEFSDYVEKVRNFAHTMLGCYIPEPNEVTEEQQDELINHYRSMFR